MTTQLTFVNQQADGSDAHVVLFQQLAVPGSAARPLVWKVIRYCGHDCSHPFRHAGSMQLCVIDAYGNYTPGVAAERGDRYRFMPLAGGTKLCRARGDTGSDLLLVRNDLEQGAIRAMLSNAGRAIAVSPPVAPQQVAGFCLGPPVLWIAMARGLEQGQPVPAELLAPGRATALPLAGLASARIVLRGGGQGAHARAHVFTLEERVPA